jgi:hypothetical protein
MMRTTHLLPALAATLLLTACHKDSDNDSGSTAPPPPTGPTTPARGQLATSPPTKVGSYSTSDLLSQLGVDSLGKELLTLAYTPACSIDVYQIQYGSVGGKGEATVSSGALMVPTGTDPACMGPRPIILYAHGTTADKTFNIANITASGNSEGLILAAIFAAQGYIVIAPNYAGYDTSTLSYHPYLDADQQAKDMQDALNAATGALPVATATTVKGNGKIFVTGYSQGGFVAMATHRLLQASGTPVTASAPMSGPYALSAFGDAIFMGQVSTSAPLNVALLVNSYQNVYGNVYTMPTDVFESTYAAALPALLPSATPIGTIYTNGQLPQTQLFNSTPPTPDYAAMTPATTPANLAVVFAQGFGTSDLITNAFRLSYLQDQATHPDGGFPTITNGLPPAAPANGFRQDLKTNDLRNWTPTAPTLLCGGNSDPTVFFLNTQLMQNYWTTNAPSAPVTVVDIDSSGAPYADLKAGFAAAKAAAAAAAVVGGASDGGAGAVLQNYHAGLVAPFCLSAVKQFFDTH